MQRTISRRELLAGLAMLSYPLIALAQGDKSREEKKKEAEKKKDEKKKDAEKKKDEAKDKVEDTDVVDGPGTDRSQDRRQDRRRDQVK